MNTPGPSHSSIRLSQVFGPSGSEGVLANDAQRNAFCRMAMRIVTTPSDLHCVESKVGNALRTYDQDIRECLREMYIRYDHGGISVGRSVRAVLLDGVTTHFDKSNLPAARQCLVPLLAMYYSPEYAKNILGITRNHFLSIGLGFTLLFSLMIIYFHISWNITIEPRSYLIFCSSLIFLIYFLGFRGIHFINGKGGKISNINL